jgi:hypothetical protein
MSDHVRAAFEHRASTRLPRGELWIGSQVFAELQTVDDVDAHLHLCRDMGMDLVSLPVGANQSSDFNYRLFPPTDLRRAGGSGLFVAAVLSGPFQRIVDQRGLHYALAEVARDAADAAGAVTREAAEAVRLVEACVENGADAVVIAEDVAYDAGSFFTASVLDQVIYPSQRVLAEKIHDCSAIAIFHSCGRITSMIPDIVSLGFDGLSCQPECLDLAAVKRAHGDRLTLLTGLSRDLLDSASLSAGQRRQFRQLVTGLGEGGGFILSSSSGLHSPQMLSSLRGLYHLADMAWGQAESSASL